MEVIDQLDVDSDREVLIFSFIEGLKPEPRLTITEWAELHKKLDSKGSAEPGPYRVARTPYLRLVMYYLSFVSNVMKVVVMKGIQGGWTEVGFNLIGYCIDAVPCPMMYVMPTVETMERNVKQRIDPMIDNCPRLVAKVGKKRSKDGGNTLKQKDGPGFVLILTGANSAAGLRSIAVRVLIGDEVDGWPGDVDNEGSPLALAENRQVTFGHNKKTYLLSTPGVEGESRIEAEFLLTDQRYYYVPCPHCEFLQQLVFEQLKWEKGKYSDVHYECISCSKKIYNRHKTFMLKDKEAGGLAEWRVTRPDLVNEKLVGFHWNSLYSPDGWLSWEEIAQKWDKAENDEPERKAFINTILGKSYKVKGDAPPWQQLFERAGAAGLERNVLWSDVAFITAGVDVQGDRLEINIDGWMKGRSSLQLDYRVLDGDVHKDDVWDQLGEILNEVWTVGSRKLQVKIMTVDTGGYANRTHDFCRKWGTSRVIPIQGRDNLEIPFAPPKAVGRTKMGKNTGKVKVWGVGVSYLKVQLYGWLRLTIPAEGDNAGVIPAGYCHLLPLEGHFFRGLTAEELVPVRNSKTNAITYSWLKRYARNEPLDCKIYSMAGAYIVGFDRWDDARWAREIGTVARGKKKAADEVDPSAEPGKKPVKKRKSKGGFWES